jgi:PPM family protein phosphatase
MKEQASKKSTPKVHKKPKASRSRRVVQENDTNTNISDDMLLAETPDTEKPAEIPESVRGSVIDMALTLFTSLSICGVRETNQDRTMTAEVTVGPKLSIVIAALLDGMGGYEGGEIASQTALTHFVATLCEQIINCCQELLHFDPKTALRTAFIAAGKAVSDAAHKSEALASMGTTLTAALVFRSTLYIASMGDSRAYLYRNGESRVLTRDDSFVQQLVEQGLLEADKADYHPYANVLTRSLGKDEDCQDITIDTLPLEPGDVVIFCSDGFWKYAQQHINQILELLSNTPADQDQIVQAAQQLINAAETAGSDDNISVSLLWNPNQPQNPKQEGKTLCQTTSASVAAVQTLNQQQKKASVNTAEAKTCDSRSPSRKRSWMSPIRTLIPRRFRIFRNLILSILTRWMRKFPFLFLLPL